MKFWNMINDKFGKKLIGSVLAGALVAAVAIPAFAQTTDTTQLDSESETQITGEEDANTQSSDDNATDTQNTEADNNGSDTEQTAEQPGDSSQETEQQDGSQETEQVEDEVLETDDEEEETQIVAYPDGIESKGSNDTIALSEEKIAEILESMPEDTSAARIGVVLNAYSLVDHVGYFWGGKSYGMGWDQKWGNTAYVYSEGSKNSGTYQTYGLDCSGYVSWVFNNAVGYSVLNKLGASTTPQWENSTETAWEDAQPGDIAFFADSSHTGANNHIGVVVGWDSNGELLVAHCSSGIGTVAVSNAASYGFKYIRTPNLYNDDSFTQAAYSYKGLGAYLLWQNTQEVDAQSGSVQIGDYVFSNTASWGTEVIVGIALGYDDSGKLMISYTKDGSTVFGTMDDGFTAVRRSSYMTGMGAAGAAVSLPASKSKIKDVSGRE